MATTLGEFGERRILREIIPKYTSGAGDDCANLGLLSGHIVITTDPVPSPAAKTLGGDEDLYWMGWLLVTINASDIAASGARPAAFVAALELPPTLSIEHFERLLAGVRDSCEANGLKYVGGNLREASHIGATGTALGYSIRAPLRRCGASKGDLVVVLGEGGRFWADAERIRAGQSIDKSTSPIFAPVSQALNVNPLHELGLLTCAMDTSDGLAPTLLELARENKLGISVDLRSMASHHLDAATRPERLWMGWGDWTVVAGIRAENFSRMQELLKAQGGQSTIIGSFSDDAAGVSLQFGDATLPLGRLESERFAADSWFSLGVDEYRRQLLNLELPSSSSTSGGYASSALSTGSC